jgi:hypothetical protein
MLKCEHTGDPQASADAIENSARIIQDWEGIRDEPDKVERRIQMLDQVGHEMEGVHGALPERINATKMNHPDLFGQYHDGQIDINDWQLKMDDPAFALDTFLHEYRHAEQDYEVRNAGADWVNGDRESAIAYNSDHYIDWEEDREGHAAQLVERDAGRFGGEAAHEILLERDLLRSDEKIRPFLDRERADAIARQRLASEQSSGS